MEVRPRLGGAAYSVPARASRWTTASTSSCAAATPTGRCWRGSAASSLVSVQPRLRDPGAAPGARALRAAPRLAAAPAASRGRARPLPPPAAARAPGGGARGARADAPVARPRARARGAHAGPVAGPPRPEPAGDRLAVGPDRPAHAQPPRRARRRWSWARSCSRRACCRAPGRATSAFTSTPWPTPSAGPPSGPSADAGVRVLLGWRARGLVRSAGGFELLGRQRPRGRGGGGAERRGGAGGAAPRARRARCWSRCWEPAVDAVAAARQLADRQPAPAV